MYADDADSTLAASDLNVLEREMNNESKSKGKISTKLRKLNHWVFL